MTHQSEDKTQALAYSLFITLTWRILMFHLFAVGAQRLAAFLGVLFASVLLAACSPQSPESVAESYIKAVANNRVDEAIGYFALGDVKENDLTAVKGKIQMIVGGQYSKIQESGGLDSVSTSLIDKKDNQARVKAEIKYKNDKIDNQTFNLIQESGKWKIAIKGF